VNELRTHIISSLCLLVILLQPLFFETNPIWILGVVIILILMLFRSSLGEIPRLFDLIFVVIYIFLSLITLYISININK
jgi:hypothetical protein